MKKSNVKKEDNKNSKTSTKKLIKRIAVISLSVIVAAFLLLGCFIVDSMAVANPKCYHKWVLSTFHGSYDKKDMPKTYWQVRSFKDKETNESLTVYAKTKLELDNLGTNHLGQVWINVSDFAGDKIEITVGYSEQNESLNKNEKAYTITSSDIKNSKDGWFKVYDYQDKTNFIAPKTSITVYWIGFSTDIRVREMVFIDSTGKVAKTSDLKEYLGNQENSGYLDLENSIDKANDESKYFNLDLLN